MRRHTALRPSAGTRIPAAMRLTVILRDAGCVGYRLGWPTDCAGSLELDHVRASHGIGMKSATEPGNLVTLCGDHHRWKTEHGREARPQLLAYLESVTA